MYTFCCPILSFWILIFFNNYIKLYIKYRKTPKKPKNIKRFKIQKLNIGKYCILYPRYPI